jgi:hypothetical protein
MKLLKSVAMLALSAAFAGCASSVARSPQTFDVCAPPQSDRDYLQSLPMAAKIGLAMSTFGAGVNAQASPIDTLLDRKRERDRQNRIDCEASKR